MKINNDKSPHNESAEEMNKRYEEENRTYDMFNRLINYCMDNKCNFDDLIECHKKFINENI